MDRTYVCFVCDNLINGDNFIVCPNCGAIICRNCEAQGALRDHDCDAESDLS